MSDVREAVERLKRECERAAREDQPIFAASVADVRLLFPDAEAHADHPADEPTITGWGLTSRHVTIRVPWSDRFITVMQTASGKLRAYEEPLSIEEIAAKHADQPATPPEIIGYDTEGEPIMSDEIEPRPTPPSDEVARLQGMIDRTFAHLRAGTQIQASLCLDTLAEIAAKRIETLQYEVNRLGTAASNPLLVQVIDDFMRDALVAIAGAVCTPEKGYAEDGGLNQLLADIKRLRKQHDQQRDRNGVVAKQVEDRDIKLTAALAERDKLQARLAEASGQLQKIVCTKEPDDGVVLLSNDGPCRWNEEMKCNEYVHVHFSPLGDALMELHRILAPAREVQS